MPDWIEQLKKGDQARAHDVRSRDEIRLHNAKIIRATAPMFWDAVLTQIETDSQRLKESFPDDKTRHCDLLNRTTLRTWKPPARILELNLNLDGQCVDVFEEKQQGRDARPTRAGQDQIAITVSSDESLEFRFRGKVHTTPAALAQHLVLYVCGIVEY